MSEWREHGLALDFVEAKDFKIRFTLTPCGRNLTNLYRICVFQWHMSNQRLDFLNTSPKNSLIIRPKGDSDIILTIKNGFSLVSVTC